MNMGKINFCSRIIFLFLIILPVEKSIGKTMADVECKGTEEKLVYSCSIYLSEMKTKKKIDSAIFVVGAEMTSMPGAHNIKPVKAHNMGMGMYHILLGLEMYGEWVLRMDFTKPRIDRIVKKIIFGKNGHGMSKDQGSEQKHNDKVMKKTHGDGDKLKHKGMPMKHNHKG